MGEDLDDRLIQDAYSVVSRPERLLGLLETLADDSSTNEVSFERIGEHFDRALSLLEEVDRDAGGTFDALIRGDEDRSGQTLPVSLQLDRNLRLTGPVPLPEFAAAFVPGEILPHWSYDLEPETERTLSRPSQAAREGEATLLRLRMREQDSEGRLFLALYNDAEPGLWSLHAIRLQWHDHSGRLFSRLMRLSKTETELARYLIDGLTLQHFADARGRSIKTVRTQMKTLQRKLGVNSQLEIVSLYGGFHASFVTLPAALSSDDVDAADRRFIAANGTAIAYRVHGSDDGTPVLYLHATADGPFVTGVQMDAIRANGFRVIAPWMPFYAGNALAATGMAGVREYVGYLRELLDHLGVERCVVVTVRVALPYGIALLNADRDRCVGLVAAGAVLPFTSPEAARHLSIGYRAPIRLARHAPGFVRLYFAGAAAMIKKGGSMKFFRSLYGASEADLDTLDDPQVKQAMSRTLERTFEDGYTSTLQQTLVSGSDWTDMAREVRQKVVLIHGEEDGLAPPEPLARFAEEHGFERQGPLAGVGSLINHQRPRLIFDTASRLLAATAN